MAFLAVVGEIGCQHGGYCFGGQTGRRTLPLPGLCGGPAGGRDCTVGAGGDDSLTRVLRHPRPAAYSGLPAELTSNELKRVVEVLRPPQTRGRPPF